MDYLAFVILFVIYGYLSMNTWRVIKHKRTNRYEDDLTSQQGEIVFSDGDSEKNKFAPFIHKVKQLDLLLASACERLMNYEAKNGITAQVQVVHESRRDLDKIESILKLLRGQPDEDVKQDDQTIEKIPDNVISLFNPK